MSHPEFMTNHETNPLVSVVIPTYNCGRYIGETIESVLAQSYKNIEVLVVDDASTDHTEEEVSKYGDKVRYLRLVHNSGGPAGPRNVGIRNASGDFIALLDSDDIFLPDKLSQEVGFLLKNPDVHFVFTNFRNFDSAGDNRFDFLRDHTDFHQVAKLRMAPRWYKIKSQEAFETLIGDNFIGTPGVVFRKSEVLKEIGLFNEALTHTDDIEFWLRVSQKYDLGYIDDVLFKRRLHENNLSSEIGLFYDMLNLYAWLRTQNLHRNSLKKLNRKIASTYFTIGYRKRLKKEIRSAVSFYLQSYKYNKANLLVLKSIVRALLPF